MEITLAPEIEARLRIYADDLGHAPEQIAAALLSRAFEEAEAEFKDTMDGLDRSAEDYNAGRWITSEEQDRRMEAKFDAARVRLSEAHAGERVAEMAQA